MQETINTEMNNDSGQLSQHSVIAITGAHGFIGHHLVNKILGRGDVTVRSLVRNANKSTVRNSNLIEVEGDLTRLDTLSDFLVSGCTVINLAYGFNLTSAANLHSAENLVEICKKREVKRLVHCSTASVFGRNADTVVNEESSCNPRSEYGRTKLLIEEILREGARGSFEFVNLRPTSVFGSEGLALTKLIANLENGSMVVNYLRSCLFNKRKLNLVGVETVVEAILFVLAQGDEIDGQTFIVSEDDEAINNFEFVEKYLLHELYGKYYPFPPLNLPLMILSLILKIRGRDADNPCKIYDSSKIRAAGFKPSRALIASLSEFVHWKMRLTPAEVNEKS